MSGGLICWATNCTEGMTMGDFALGLLIAVGIVTGIVLLIRWLIPDK